MELEGQQALAELSFASRHPDVLSGTLVLDVRALETPEGVSAGLRALADFDAFSASLRAMLVDRQTQHVADQPLEGRDGQPERLGGNVAHAAAVAEIAAIQGTSEAAAARTVNFSSALVNVHPALHTALASGDVTEAHARVVVDQASTLPDEVAEAFGIEALSRLRTRKGRLRTPGEFRAVVRDLRERLHPESIVKRRAAARQDRRVWLRPDDDGMCTLAALLPAETAKAAYGRIDAIARAARDGDGEYRTLAQLRADVLVQLAFSDQLTPLGEAGHVRRALEGDEPGFGEGHAPVPSLEELIGRIKPEVVVHLRPEVVLGASDDVAHLEGYGVIDAGTARLLAAAAPGWQKLYTDDEGVPVKLGRAAYRPSAGLLRFIRYRDGECLVPGCSCAAQRAEVDHAIEWQDGGTTDAENLTLLCAKHHALKSLAIFRLRRQAAAEQGGLPPGGDPPTISGDLVWQTILGGELPAEPIDREHILGPRPPDLQPRPAASQAPESAPSPAAHCDEPPF